MPLEQDQTALLQRLVKGNRVTPVVVTASGLVLNGPGRIVGYHINSHTAGATVRFSDAKTATTPYLGAAFATAAGTLPQFQQFPAVLNNGCYVTITGTINITIFVIREDI